MRRALVALAVVVALVAVASAAERPSKKSTAATTRAVVKTLRGEIVALNIETKVITVRASKQNEARELAVATDDKTQFTLDGNPVTLVDLKPGMLVSVLPDTGVATKIVAKTPAPARKTKSIAGDKTKKK